MDLSTLRILCCPVCNGTLTAETERLDRGQLVEGTLFCARCRRHYGVCEGVADLYIPDDEAIARSGERRFQDLVVTAQKLNDLDCNNHARQAHSSLTTNQKFSAFLLVGVGWIFVLYAILIALSRASSSFLTRPSLFALSLLIALSLFAADFYTYRSFSKSKYIADLHTLHALSHDQKLSEHDMGAPTKDDEASLANQRNFVAYKGAWIRSVLERSEFATLKELHQCKGLNVGCGGTLTGPASKPYFDHGFTMLGVDVNKNSVKEYTQAFATDGVVANGVALPFKADSFDLITFTDILEHLHHALLGLQEAQRVLKGGGILLLSTNNRCALKSLRCLNPFVTAERIISLYDDSALPPRTVLGRWMDVQFYHTEFSKDEITQLLRAAGFSLVHLETRFPFPSLAVVNTIWKRVPVLRYLCSEFFLVARDHEDQKASQLNNHEPVAEIHPSLR
ncbi:MAG: methyltransferase domain-containing protein [Halobacteriota archaeon]